MDFGVICGHVKGCFDNNFLPNIPFGQDGAPAPLLFYPWVCWTQTYIYVLDLGVPSYSNVILFGRDPLNFRSNILLPYLGVLINLWLFQFPLFLFAAQPKEFFLDGLKKLEQRSHKCVELREEYVE
jgi:hypothetical protein